MRLVTMLLAALLVSGCVDDGGEGQGVDAGYPGGAEQLALGSWELRVGVSCPTWLGNEQHSRDAMVKVWRSPLFDELRASVNTDWSLGGGQYDPPDEFDDRHCSASAAINTAEVDCSQVGAVHLQLADDRMVAPRVTILGWREYLGNDQHECTHDGLPPTLIDRGYQ